MEMKAKYRTRQRQEIMEFLKNSAGKHFTAADISAYYREHGTPVGKTTVYRQLDALLSAGQIKKYIIDEASSACYEYIGDRTGEMNPLSYHLKCEKCGRLIHLECGEITEFEAHIAGTHGFRIDPMRTVFYGICSDCAARSPEKEGG